MNGSLRLRLTLTYVGLAVLPVVVVSALVAHRTVSELRAESEALQRAIADRVATELTAFVDGRFDEARTFVLGSGLARLDAPAQRVALEKLLAHDRHYQAIELRDGAGRLRMRLSRTEPSLAAAQGQDPDPARHGQAPTRARDAESFGNVRFDDDAREPLATLSLPVRDRRSGELAFVLVTDLRLSGIWRLLGRLDLPNGIDVFVLDPEGRVVAHRNPATVLGGTRIEPPLGVGTLVHRGVRHLGVSTAVERAGQRLIVLALRPTSSAYATATRSLVIIAVVATVAVLVAVLLVVISARQLVRPIEALARAAGRVSAGDLEFEPELGGRGEVRALGLAFTQMLHDLRASREAEREAHERLARQDKLAALGQMAGELGHELRNPLGTIANSATVLESSLSDGDAPSRRAVARISSQVHRINRLTGDLLSFARTRDPDRVDATVARLLDAALEKQPPPDGIEVRRGSADEAAEVRVDEDQIGQVLENVLRNAYEAMADGGQVSIEVTAGHGTVTVTLTDTGSGIEPEVLERVFEPLFTTKRKGVGLGLAICRSLAEVNGGQLTLRSTVGAGTTCVLELPATTAPALQSA